jgi:TatD DNase family protein
MAVKALDRGYSLSAAANLTYPRKAALRELFRRLPAVRILVETDAPDIPPWTRRGEVHNPWDLPVVVAALAAARGECPEAVAEATEANARRLFAARGVPITFS